MNSDYRKDLRVWAPLMLLPTFLKNWQMWFSSGPRCSIVTWSQAVRSLWLLAPTVTTTITTLTPPLLSLSPGSNRCSGPTGNSHGSHIKVLLSNSANGACSVKQPAQWGRKTVPLRSLQHSSHSVNHPTHLHPRPPSNHTISSHTSKLTHNNKKAIYVFIELFEAGIKSGPVIIQLKAKAFAQMLTCCATAHTHTNTHI